MPLHQLEAEWRPAMRSREVLLDAALAHGTGAHGTGAHGTGAHGIVGRVVEPRAYRMEGVLTLVATSLHTAAVPRASQLTGCWSGACTATGRGAGVYLLGAGAGGRSLLVAAAMPALEQAGVAMRLGVVPA